MKVAYLGPAGTFSEMAARVICADLEKRSDFLSLQPIRNVIMAVESRKADLGVVPIENFYNGEVRETLDSLAECLETKIIQERAFTIVHCLGALPNHGKINRILSKDQALEQCSRYLCENYADVEKIAVSSTKEAAQIVIRDNLMDAAAIASEEGLKGLEVLAKDICPNNKTRFVVLGRDSTKPSGDDKTFLAIHPEIKDRPGVLDKVLRYISDAGINLEYIQSRPDGNKGYCFYLELNGHTKDEYVSFTLKRIKDYLDPEGKFPNSVKILGSYRNTHWKDEN